jgi:two-component system OmpR family response regulator
MASDVKCLYVDDDPGVRDLVTLTLRAEGVDVHVADNGFSVEQMVEDIRPDIVLLDVMMPGRDGYDVLSSLKSSCTTCEVPVVLLTARASDAEIWQGWQAGADYYLTKPFNVDHLVEYLQIVIAERRTR